MTSYCIVPTEILIIMNMKQQLQKLQSVFQPLMDPLTRTEKAVVDSYNPNLLNFPYNKIRRDDEAMAAYVINDFAIPSIGKGERKGESEQILGFCNLTWMDYFRLCSSCFVADECLTFLHKYMLHLLPDDFKKDVNFANPLATGDLTNKNNTTFKTGGTGFAPADRGSYNRFFGKNNTFSRLKRVYFPFHMHGSHFVGGIANRVKETVFTFDSFGKNEGTHDEMFDLLCPLLDHALQFDKAPSIQWKHVKLEVPIQRDSINCGLFRNVNGIILTCVEDPTSDEVKSILFTQDMIEKVRIKLQGLILENSKLKYTPKCVKEIFDKASEQLRDQDAVLKAATARAKAKMEKRDQNKRIDEELSAKGLYEVDDELAFVTKERDAADKLKARAAADKLKAQAAADKQSTKTLSLQSTTDLALSTGLKKALRLSQAVTFEKNVIEEALTKLTTNCDQGLILKRVKKKTSQLLSLSVQNRT